jgi:diguanylate cyclase (GGDEF)-like protein
MVYVSIKQVQTLFNFLNKVACMVCMGCLKTNSNKEIKVFIEKIRHTITLKAAFMSFVITLLATIIRPMMIEQSVIFTYIGIANSFAMACVYLYLKNSQPKFWHPMLFVFVAMMLLFPIVVVSGGVNSQFTYLFPIAPIFIALVSNARYTWITAIVIILFLISLFFSVDIFPDFTDENVPESKTAARALWLSLSVLLSAKFGIEFNRLNSTLGNKLSEQAEIDALTGLHNRRSVMNFLQVAMDEAKLKSSNLSLMMIDLDHFKSINDTHGHLAGDKCLMSVALSIRECVRNTSDLAGRFGGEEFMVVIKDVDAQKATDIANKIRLAIEHALIELNDGQQIKLSTTIGVCTLSSENLCSIEHFVDLADQALYQGKNAGRNCVIAA